MRHRLHLVKSKRNFPTMMTSYQCRRTDNVIRTDPNIERFFFQFNNAPFGPEAIFNVSISNFIKY